MTNISAGYVHNRCLLCGVAWRGVMLCWCFRYDTTVFNPNRGMEDPNACITALTNYQGYWGPWLPHSADLPFVPTPSLSLVPTISYLDSFWHPPQQPASAPPSSEVQPGADRSWIGSVAVFCGVAFVIGVCLGAGRRRRPKAGSEELIEMTKVEIS